MIVENENEESAFEVDEGADLESTIVDHGNEEADAVEETVAAVEEQPEADEQEEDHADEVEQYGKKVQKRIKKLTGQLREAERREQAAIQYAKGVQTELAQKDALKTQVRNKDEALFDQYNKNVDSNLSIAKENFKRAHDSGDTEAMIEAQQDIAKLTVEQENLKRVAVRRKTAAAQVSRQQAQQQQVQQVQQVQQAQQRQAQQTVDPRAQEWAIENDWFGNDKIMTHTAFGIHEKLKEEGVDPSSEIYYNRLDKELMSLFPDKFSTLGNSNTNGSNQTSSVQTVSGANRSVGNKGRSTKVRLTQSEIAIANKLGVPLEQYAKHKKIA
jgi:type II secretory pathway pseudopilin PulG